MHYALGCHQIFYVKIFIHKKTKACSSDEEIHYLSHSPQMMVYLVVQLVEEFETDATKPDSLDIASNKVSKYYQVILQNSIG